VLKKENNFVIAVVGDGSMTGGIVYEALNNAGRTNSRLIVVVNDNEMSISKNVGAMARYLAAIRTKPRYYRFKAKTESMLNRIPLVGRPLATGIFKVKKFLKSAIYKSTWFEELGFRYIGPIDGHNIQHLTEAFKSAKIVNHPVVVHINTVKGKGYDLAERSPTEFHGIAKFDMNTGEPIPGRKSFSAQFGEFMCEVAEKDRRICAITAAMSVGTGLEGFRENFSNRFFDVGIAEGHAITFASGLAKNGMLPVVAIYSSFLQRCYDQLIHDVALQGSKVVIAIDRAGFVGEDGETHQGIYDVAFMNSIPHITVYAPSNFTELKSHMNTALYHEKSVVAVRYPRGEEPQLPGDFEPSFGNFDVYGDEDAETVIVTYGRCFSFACSALAKLAEQGVTVKILKLNRIKPIDSKALEAVSGARRIFFFEEGVRSAGVGEKFALLLLEAACTSAYHLTAVDDCFVEQATVKDQLEKYRLDEAGIVNTVLGRVDNESKEEA
ncbi:MAG TPA: 1-deoxy-D-xylulose-5-phosphate synthase, partial [Clostridia bacterium]|nr:1-deoxy-D-xylulose-5-phosphate synthase [Clostridia bacterium]